MMYLDNYKSETSVNSEHSLLIILILTVRCNDTFNIVFVDDNNIYAKGCSLGIVCKPLKDRN